MNNHTVISMGLCLSIFVLLGAACQAGIDRSHDAEGRPIKVSRLSPEAAPKSRPGTSRQGACDRRVDDKLG